MVPATAAPCRLAKPCDNRAVRPLWRFPRQTAKLCPAGAVRRRRTHTIASEACHVSSTRIPIILDVVGGDRPRSAGDHNGRLRR